MPRKVTKAERKAGCTCDFKFLRSPKNWHFFGCDLMLSQRRNERPEPKDAKP